MPALPARGDLGARLGDDERVEAEGVLVDAAVRLGQRRRLAVGDHDDLPHVLALSIEDPPRQPEAFARVRVVRTDADPPELGQRDLLRRIVKEHDLQGVARVLRLDQLRERQRDPLGRREPILAVQDHAVAAVEHQHGRAGALVLALDDHQVVVRHVDAARPALAAPADVRAAGLRAGATPSRLRARTAFSSVPAASRFSVSPNSYGFGAPVVSTPVACSRVS